MKTESLFRKLSITFTLMFLTVFSNQAQSIRKVELFKPVVKQVVVDNHHPPKMIDIYGKRFGNKRGTIYLAGQSLTEIESWNRDHISVALPANIKPGTYELEIDSISLLGFDKKVMVTIGAVGATGEQGEAGETGPQGEVGPRGQQGPVGPAGQDGSCVVPTEELELLNDKISILEKRLKELNDRLNQLGESAE